MLFVDRFVKADYRPVWFIATVYVGVYYDPWSESERQEDGATLSPVAAMERPESQAALVSCMLASQSVETPFNRYCHPSTIEIAMLKPHIPY